MLDEARAPQRKGVVLDGQKGLERQVRKFVPLRSCAPDHRVIDKGPEADEIVGVADRDALEPAELLDRVNRPAGVPTRPSKKLAVPVCGISASASLSCCTSPPS